MSDESFLVRDRNTTADSRSGGGAGTRGSLKGLTGGAGGTVGCSSSEETVQSSGRLENRPQPSWLSVPSATEPSSVDPEAVD